MAEKSKDETVDGPKIAAQILNRMRTPNKERILQQIATSDPHLAQKISDNVFSFEDIADLMPQGAQLLIKEIEHKDLIVSLKSASDKVKNILFAICWRKLQIVREYNCRQLSLLK
jgi:flagellar motor switch protein FliG